MRRTNYSRIVIASLAIVIASGLPARPEDPSTSNGTAYLTALQKKLGKGASYRVGDSKAFRLVQKTKQALLQANMENVPMFAVNPEVEKRAFDVAVHAIAATRIPKNFRELDAMRPKKLPVRVLRSAPGADPSAVTFDWRALGKTTPVRTYLSNTGQDGCGCCWCFAAIAAYEGNRLLVIGGDPATFDASEQHILNCGNTGGCNGDWYYTAWAYMQSHGTATEANVPYAAVVGSCNTGVATPCLVDTYGLVSHADDTPSRAAIKNALSQYGPLAVAVDATQNFVAYADGVFIDYPSDPANVSVNHAVTLIGWDDTQSAWLIKNSWGNDWGSSCGLGSEKGYMWIGYENNNIGYAAAWTVAKD